MLNFPISCYELRLQLFWFWIQDWDRQNPTQIITEICGFVTILSGTFLLHKTKDMVDGMFLLRYLPTLHFWIHDT